MANVAIIETLPSVLTACTVSRNIEEFELLIDAMEETFGESWGDISFEDALPFLAQDDSTGLRFLVIAVNAGDDGDLDRVADIVAAGKARGLGVIVLSETISPVSLHKVMRSGADDFLPYPLPDDVFDEAIHRLEDKFAAEIAARAAAQATVAAAPPAHLAEVHTLRPNNSQDRDGVIFPVHGMAGGVGSTTMAVNLAHELAVIAAESKARVCLLDLDFQFGNVATYLDLTRRETVTDFLSDAGAADFETFMGALQTTKDGLYVLTAPSEMMPLEILGANDVGHILDIARANFDYVVIDMPTTVVSWTEAVLNRAHVYFGLVELDLRSAQNVLRMLRALKSESLPHEKLRYALNYAPGFTDLAAKARVKRMAESLDIAIDLHLPDGGTPVSQANDQGLPLAKAAAKNALRREIQKLAKSLVEVNTTDKVAANPRR